MPLPFYTVGHSTRDLDAFVALLQAADVSLVADVRSIPRSRRYPHYNTEALPGNLAPYNIRVEHLPALGGRRPKSKTTPPAVNGYWDNQSFHNYADYALTDTFQAGLGRLIALGRAQRTAIMCAEAVWWRCHRRIVADHLLARGEQVFHLMGSDRITPATLTKGAAPRADGTVIYPPDPEREAS